MDLPVLFQMLKALNRAVATKSLLPTQGIQPTSGLQPALGKG